MNKKTFLAAPFLLIWFIACNNKSKNSNTLADTTTTSKGAVASDSLKDEASATEQSTQYAANISDPQTVDLVRSKLQSLFGDDLAKNIIGSGSRKFTIFRYDLNDDGKQEIFTGFNGSYFCGTGGCSWLLLDDAGNTITRFTVTDYPVVISADKTNAWKDLIVSTGGKNHLLKFNGKNYPSNPSVQPLLKSEPANELTKVFDYNNEAYPWFKF